MIWCFGALHDFYICIPRCDLYQFVHFEEACLMSRPVQALKAPKQLAIGQDLPSQISVPVSQQKYKEGPNRSNDDNRHEPPHIQRWNDERQFSNSGPRRNYGERDGYNHEFDRRDGSRERFSEGGQSIKRFRGEEGHAEYNGYTAQRTRYR